MFIPSSGFIPLIVGVDSFVSVSWSLVQQETVSNSFRTIYFCSTNRLQERRCKLKRRQVADQDENGIELESLLHNLGDAISQASSQPDTGFSTNGVAFPNHVK